tara:strand:+ start:946 stop:1191 length:246 start_codon:yes stop_codon:yes gene_type:complete
MTVTQQQAEALATKAITEYLNACDMQSREDIGNVLMKLASVTGLLMACNEGREIAAQRLEGTAAFIRKNGPQFPQRLETVQ